MKKIKTVIMGAGLGDVVMGCQGVIAMELLGLDPFANDAAFHVRSNSKAIAQILLEGRLVVAKSESRSRARPRYHTYCKYTLNTAFRNLLTPDFHVSFSGARALLVNGARKPTLTARFAGWANEYILEGKTTMVPPSYSGIRMWSPLIRRLGVAEPAFRDAIGEALAVAQSRVLFHLDEKFTGARTAPMLSIFPGGNSFQYLPPEFALEFLKQVGVDDYCCYFAPGDSLRADYQAANIRTEVTSDFTSLLAVVRDSRVCATSDSFVSHLAQILSPAHLLLLSRDLPENVVHPFARSKVIFQKPACAPCLYLERPPALLCAAGRKSCAAFSQDQYLASAVRQTLDLLSHTRPSGRRVSISARRT